MVNTFCIHGDTPGGTHVTQKTYTELATLGPMLSVKSMEGNTALDQLQKCCIQLQVMYPTTQYSNCFEKLNTDGCMALYRVDHMFGNAVFC